MNLESTKLYDIIIAYFFEMQFNSKELAKLPLNDTLKFFSSVAKNHHTLDNERFREVVESFIE